MHRQKKKKILPVLRSKRLLWGNEEVREERIRQNASRRHHLSHTFKKRRNLVMLRWWQVTGDKLFREALSRKESAITTVRLNYMCKRAARYKSNTKLKMALNARLRSSVWDKCSAKACWSVFSREVKKKEFTYHLSRYYLSIHHLLGTNSVPGPLPSALYTVSHEILLSAYEIGIRILA